MKNTFSKPHPRLLTLARNFLGLFAIMALAGILCVAQQYFSYQRIIRSRESHAEILDLTRETEQSYCLLRVLSEGKTGEARAMLGQRLADDILALDSSLPATDQYTRSFVEGTFKLIARDYGQHPENYPLASTSSTNEPNRRFLRILQQASLAAN
jgi:hypothetical protein